MRALALLLLLTTAALAGEYPDPQLTPGMVRQITLAEICNTKWGLDARAVSASMKRKVFLSYGYTGNDDPRCDNPNSATRRCEIDHRVPRELGGADDIKNLGVQPYAGPWNAQMKDRLENLTRKMVCTGRLSPEEGQAVFLGDWRAGYRKYIGEAGAMR